MNLKLCGQTQVRQPWLSHMSAFLRFWIFVFFIFLGMHLQPNQQAHVWRLRSSFSTDLLAVHASLAHATDAQKGRGRRQDGAEFPAVR